MSVHNLPTQDGFEGDDEDEDENEDEHEDMEDVPESRSEGTSSNRNEFFLYWSSQGYNVMDPQFLAWAQQQGHGWPQPSVEERLQSEIASLINLAIPDESIKSHFWALLNCWQHDMAQLKNILKQCYQYIGIMPSVPVPLEADYKTYAPKPKLYQAPQHCAEGKVELADMVRQEVWILMKIIPGDDDIQTEADATNGPPLKKPLATVSTATLLLWKKNLAEGPSVRNFVLQLDGGIRTVWNKAAAIVFCRYFVAKHACYKVDDVKTAFMTRITQLCRDFEQQGKEKTAEEFDEERRARRLARRDALLDRRVRAFQIMHYSDPAPLQTLANFVKYLCIDCMSGDESGPEKKSYKTRVRWRSHELAEFLQLLSGYHLKLQYLGQGKYTRGVFPHARYASN
ncbi:hypothetical protein DFH05DRAFT_1459297 [Lentinula detonsa]|uniref:Uncharacterized protein n=1 Tax=Lentinula detonsa TaxID=2804962 RepID=A0A9W8P289_9AGAR|nr:hypothetical protein DFH05DRAFT_1459297 [Lentinula detonsa]